jgi:hypothetical protein
MLSRSFGLEKGHLRVKGDKMKFGAIKFGMPAVTKRTHDVVIGIGILLMSVNDAKVIEIIDLTVF